MKYRHWLILALAAAVSLKAAPKDDDEEDFSDIGFYANAKNKVTLGFRVNRGATVHFGRVGSVSSAPIQSLLDGPAYPNGPTTTYTYSNGRVDGDSLRPNEIKYNADGSPVLVKDANGVDRYVQTSTPGGRYTTNSGPQYDSNGNIIVGDDGKPLIVTTGDFLSYTNGQSRGYGFDGPAQILPDGSGLVFTQYSAVSTGANVDGEDGISAGFELQVGRQLGRFAGGRLDFSVVGGLSLNDINSKKAGTVQGKLRVVQDTFYFANGGTIPTDSEGYTAPVTGDYVDEVGGVHLASNETSIPLNGSPDASKHTDNIDDPNARAIDVTGVWKLRGAYFGLRVGSELRAAVSKNFGVSLGAGLAGAYAATTFTAVEQFTIEGIATPIGVEEFSETTKFLPGYYANLDANYALNERTGVYAGVGYEVYDEYEQSVGGRTARVDLGNTATIRGGISIKF